MTQDAAAPSPYLRMVSPRRRSITLPTRSEETSKISAAAASLAMLRAALREVLCLAAAINLEGSVTSRYTNPGSSTCSSSFRFFSARPHLVGLA
jgi:hypothetical protein